MSEKKKNLMTDTVAVLDTLSEQMELLNSILYSIAVDVNELKPRLTTFADNVEKALSVLSNTTVSAATADAESIKKRTTLAQSLMPKAEIK